MYYLLVSILSNVAFFILFKAYGRFGVKAIQAIVFNYIVAALLALVFADATQPVIFQWSWLITAVLLGTIFIIGFFLISGSTQTAGITPTSIASKLSLVLPAIFSLYVFEYHDRPFDIWNYTGLGMAVLSIVLSSVSGSKTQFIIGKEIILPFLVFLTGGAIDTLINYANYRFSALISDQYFLMVTLGAAGLIGIVYVFINKLAFDVRSMIGGALLGLANFSALYFVMLALDEFGHNGAVLFPVQNMGVIVFSSILAAALFRERFTALNLSGILLALLSILLISYQHFIN